MLKKVTIGCLVIAVAVMVAVFAYNEVLAADCLPPPTECILKEPCGQDQWCATNYKIVFNANNPYVVNVGGVDKLLWSYDLPNGPSVNQMSLLAPACCEDSGYEAVSGGQVILPGSGDPTSGLGKFNFQDFVIRLAYSNPYAYAFYTRKPIQGSFPLGNVSIQIKSGKNYYACENIAAPVCGESALIPISLSGAMTIGGHDVCYNKDLRGCINKLYNCGTGVEYPKDPPLPAGEQYDCGDALGADKCRQCIQSNEASPGCSSVVVMGSVTRIPPGCCSRRIACPSGFTCDTSTWMCVQN